MKIVTSPRPSTRRRFVLAALVAAGATLPLLPALPAHAYSGSEHIRFPDQAYQLLNVMRRGGAYALHAQALDPVGAQAGKYKPLTQCPESICPSSTCANGACPAGVQWNRFITQALPAPAKLDKVKTDLADPNPVLVTKSCGGELLHGLAPGDLAKCRIGELPFPPRRNWGTNQNECFLRRGYIMGGADQDPSDPDHPEAMSVLPFYEDQPANFSGATLGLWATGPDDAQDDTHVWVRPTSLLFASAINGIIGGLVDAGLTVGFLAVAPIFCLADYIFGGSDCVGDAESAAHVVGAIPDEALGVLEQDTIGQWDFRGSDCGAPLPGLWHFATIDADGQFNKVAGTKFIDGGFQGDLDDLDVSIIAVSDLLGLTIQSDTSQGVANYTPFADGDLRTVGDWIDPTLGHVEFEPLQNLAKYGWTQFHAGKLNAKGLGWVLHAIGDAGQPHHTISAVGWGHAEWERFANLSWEENLHEEDILRHYPDLQQEVAIAFQWWKFFDDQQTQTGSTDLAVREMILAFAAETAHLPVSTKGRAFIDDVSEMTQQADPIIRNMYGKETPAMGDLMRRAIGASMGFMVKASDFITTSGTSPCDCGKGSGRSGQDSTGKIVTAPDGICHVCGQGPFAKMPNWVDGTCVAVCPADKPTAQAGACTATNVCPVTAPFFDNNKCVAKCSGTKVVVNNRLCQATCPAPQKPDTAGFCVGMPPANPRKCNGASGDNAAACCSPHAAACLTNADCCSLSCTNDGFCRGIAGDQCVVTNDCLSGACTNSRCGVSSDGGACVSNKDCVSSICSAQHICLGADGDSCTASAQCGSGFCSIPPNGFVGVCGPVPACAASGERCDLIDGPSCCRGLICTAGACGPIG